MGTKKEAVNFALMHSDIKYIKKVLSGNGEKGLIKDTRENTDFRIGHTAKENQLKFIVGGGFGISIILFIISLFV